MAVDERLEKALKAALKSPDPVLALRSEASELLSSDHDAGIIYAAMQTLALRLRETGMERDEDIVTDVMDFIVGFCSPHTGL